MALIALTKIASRRRSMALQYIPGLTKSPTSIYIYIDAKCIILFHSGTGQKFPGFEIHRQSWIEFSRFRRTMSTKKSTAMVICDMNLSICYF